MEPAGIINALGGWIGVVMAGPLLVLLVLAWYLPRAMKERAEVDRVRDLQRHERELEGVRWREREVAALTQVTAALQALQASVDRLGPR